MKSKVAGKNYEILVNDKDKFAIKVDKKVTDNCLSKLSKAMETINKIMLRKSECENSDLFDFLEEKVFQKAGLEIDEGLVVALFDANEEIKEIQNVLATHDDNIRPRSEVETLEDMGYSKRISGSGKYPIWEHVWSYNAFTEIEEIILKPEKPMRRLRTIREYVNCYGIKTDERKKRKLKISQRLKKAIQNTIAENHLIGCSPQEGDDLTFTEE